MTKHSDLSTRLMLILIFIILAAGCKGKAPKEIEQGANAIGSMLRPVNLSRSMFAAAFPKGKPSQFVSYIFSDMGAAEWPPTGDSGEFSKEEMKAMKRSGMIKMPAEVAFVPMESDKSEGKQIVVKFDDTRGVVITEGYTDPTQKPVLVKEWKLPHVKPAPGVREIYQSNLQLGMSDQAF